MKKKHFQKTQFSIFGYFGFFILVCGVATCSILSFSFILEKSGGNKETTAILTLVVLVFLALICTFIDVVRRKLTVERPVRLIVDATERITSGDFSVKLTPLHTFEKYNEFDLIMDNINTMTSELSKNEVLKSDFITNISHEIKSPLALIQNYAVGLQNERLTSEQKNEYIQTLLGATKRLSDLITNILKLNKLENQEIFAEKTVINLGEQLRESILIFEDKFEKKNLKLECDIDDVTIMSDARLLEVIWSNLISNAIKFTDDYGKITISLKDMGNNVIVSFSDSGVGMSVEVGERIFDKFYQGEVSRSVEGNGLGLTLVKRIIDILGGEISVQSQIGKGSKFTIIIRKEIE